MVAIEAHQEEVVETRSKVLYGFRKHCTFELLLVLAVRGNQPKGSVCALQKVAVHGLSKTSVGPRTSRLSKPCSNVVTHV